MYRMHQKDSQSIWELLQIVDRHYQSMTAVCLCRRADGVSSLMLAAQSADLPLVQMLLKNGANEQATDVNGLNAMCWCCRNSDSGPACVPVINALASTSVGVRLLVNLTPC
jgi:hypothetical protein